MNSSDFFSLNNRKVKKSEEYDKIKIKLKRLFHKNSSIKEYKGIT
jgi:hypothetical protein